VASRGGNVSPSLDPKGTPQFGLVAEDVKKLNPDLVVRDDEGKVYTVRYEAVNAMLLNEFLKEHRKVEEQEAAITELKSAVAKQQNGMEVLTATLKSSIANPEGDRRARSEELFTANRPQQSVRVQ